ncbi:MAG: hypothetical protein AABX91_00520 [Nanoarchaeota archaeon]
MKKSSKKRASKKGSSKEKVTRIIHESTRETKVDKALVENFIALQKVMVNLSAKFDHLSGEISKLLELFEISAKSLARKDFEESGKSSQETERILEKLNNISQQAGLIGKGLALIHETRSERAETSFQGAPVQRVMPTIPVRPISQINKPMPSAQDYQKSIQPKASETGA